MGTWGTGISSNDTFEDIKDEFFELYNDGQEPTEITKELVNSNPEIIGDKEDANNFWFALALCQWECKSLEPELLERITEIIESGTDIELWKELGAEKSELTKRKKVLDKFLEKLNSEKKSPKKRKKKKFRDSIFQKGDCLTFKLANQNYGGAFVLEAEKQTEFGMNLIAITDISKETELTLKDFESAKVLIRKEEQAPGNFKDREQVTWYYAQFKKRSTTDFTVIGQLEVTRTFNFNSDYTGASDWDMIPDALNMNAELVELRGEPSKTIKLKKLRKKTWL